MAGRLSQRRLIVQRRVVVRVGVVVALLAGMTPLLAAPPAAALVVLDGKVTSLARALAGAGIRLETDATPILVLQTDDGRILPLLPDVGARPLFKDRALLDRPVRITGRMVPRSSFLQVRTLQSRIHGVLHDVFYWCDICSIRRGEKNLCECCGGPMELREEPVRK